MIDYDTQPKDKIYPKILTTILSGTTHTSHSNLGSYLPRVGRK